jgi:hypothetical protein
VPSLILIVLPISGQCKTIRFGETNVARQAFLANEAM